MNVHNVGEQTVAAGHMADSAAVSRSSVLFLVGDGERPCGVGDFTYGMARAYGQDHAGAATTLELGRDTGSLTQIWRAVRDARAVVCNLPIVSWKRVLGRPVLTLALARLRGAHTVVMLHEWGAVHWLRRLVLRPLLWLAQDIVLFSPLVRAEVLADRFVAPVLGRITLAPLPPNIERPAKSESCDLASYMAAQREEGRLVLATFGSIYPGKTPDALLAAAAELKARGRRPLLVFIGSFIKARGDNVEEDFMQRIAALGLDGDVLVSGHVASHAALFGLFDAADALVYSFAEGLTSRRGSVLVCAQSGKPVIANAPQGGDDFAHHPRYRALIDSGAIVAVPSGGGVAGFADAVEAAVSRPVPPVQISMGEWWSDVVKVVRGLF